VSELFVAPGNPGTHGTAVDVDPASPVAVTDAARRLSADLVVVGPEAPLVAGVPDALREQGVAVFGPQAGAARIEASKAHAKTLMKDAGIPTAAARLFSDTEAATRYLDELGPPYVVKADGLAAGKGVTVTTERDEAISAVEDCLVHGRFGSSGARVLIEEFLDGEEASLIAFTDGTAVLACEPAQDYKRAFDGDEGPNTGGMGSYSPVPSCPPELAQRITDEVIRPMVSETSSRGASFAGAIYAGLALTAKGPRVVEFNARFGDPETQALLPRLRSDFAEVCMASATGELEGATLEWSDEPCVSVVLASGGYPGDHQSGLEITGIEDAAASPSTFVFQGGTVMRDDKLVTAGGRVLAVSALGQDFGEARRRAYEAASKIRFEGMHLRTDIALRAEERKDIR
jgi:phosphoribosylamine--glycine ligase